MKMKLSADIVFLAVACAATIAGARESYAAQGVPSTPPVHLTSVLEQKQGVMQGESIRLRFDFRDTSGANLFAQTDGDLRWCTFEVRKGEETVAKWQPKRRIRAGAWTPDIRLMDLSSPKSDSAVLLSELTQVPPGKYILRVSTRVKYATASYARSNGNLDQSPTEVRDTFDIPLLIKPQDPVVLKERVGFLYRSLLREKDSANFYSLAYEIARMPPDLAVRAWRSLLQNPSVDRYLFADALSAVVSKPVVDTLIYVQFTKPIYNEAGKMQNLITLLNGMQASAESPELRQYIRDEVAKRQGSVFNGPSRVD